MESIHLFLQEVTKELLYNIVYEYNEIDYSHLIVIFTEKTGYHPMDFFGFGDQTSRGCFDLIAGIPGVQGRKIISIVSDLCSESSEEDSNCGDSEDEYVYVYKVFNKTYLCSAYGHSVSIANYREMILINCCEMIGNDADLSKCKDANGNTPLHYIAALPGLTYDCHTLVKYLLQAGVDPLATNNNGQTFLHIIFGRFRPISYDKLYFKKTRVSKTKWFVKDRVALLELLSQNLSPTYTALLAKAQDKNGNTILHEYLLSTVDELTDELTDENDICKELLKFGASLRIPNNLGEVPLHYAFSSELFKIFLQNGAVCRARNDRDESPVLFILKKSAAFAFTGTSAVDELVNEAFAKTTLNKSVYEAIKLLKNLKNTLSQNGDVKKTVWIADVNGNIAISVLLIAIRIGSYGLPIWNRPVLCSAMVELLGEILRDASPSEMKWANKKGQSLLHVLLDMGDDNEHTISEEEYICQTVEILLKHNADVNAVDLQGHTPLDIAYKYCNNLAKLYQKCIKLLIKHGAKGQQNTLTRKLRYCPKRHCRNAERLTDSRIQVTVVEKYRYSIQNLIGSGAFSSIFVAIKDENVDSESGRIECRAFA